MVGSGVRDLRKAASASAVAGKKRRKLVKTRLPQGLVDEIMKQPVTPFPAIPDDLLAEFSEECRAAIAMQKADTDELVALDADIIRQYKDNGYAVVQEEVVTDTNDDNENMGSGDRDHMKTKEALLATTTTAGCAGAGKKRKKTRLPQELVNEITRRPVTPFPAIPDELLAEFSEKCRAAFAMQRADTEELMALDADIIRQYKNNGYAEVEEDVVTDEDEEQKAED